jgi:hypothetical protein
MKNLKLKTLVAASLVVAFSPLALQAQTTSTSSDIDKQTQLLNTTAENKGQTQVATKIASSFTKLAGSQDNALTLVRALRDGSLVMLTTTTTGTGTPTGTTTTTSFTPPTGKMGWGNVFNSLALAQDSLARAGITNPTNAQLQAALMGGDVTNANGTTTTLKGILQMRADGMGWGQIAQASGTKLGPVVSSIRSTQHTVAALPTTTTPGVTTPTTAAASSSKSLTTAAGTTTPTAKGGASSGVVTAAGASAGSITHGNSANAPGKGVVTAAGGSAGVVTHGNSASAPGQGVVNAAGGNASGVTTAGNAGGNGKGNAGGNGNGKGKGGG